MTSITKQLCAASLAGLLMMTSGFAATDPSAAIDAAKAAKKKASSVDGEWRDVSKLIKQAEKALKEGDSDAAIKLAAKAQQQGELGYEQAIDQKEAGPRF